MFRKKTFKASSDFGFDADLTIPEFDFRESRKKEDRVPVTKHAKEFVRGAAGGLWEGARSRAFISRTLREALPAGYGSAMDRADEAASSIRDLYNASVREIKPVQNELRRTVAKLLPAGGKFLPKSAQDRLKSWAESADTGTGFSTEAARHASLQATLGDIFSYQAETQAQQRAEDQAEANIQKQIETDRAGSQLSHLNSIRLALQRLADYQDRVTVNYQRKSLEVQLRHYFVAMDTLIEQRKQGVATRELLTNIQKNTALPDLLKIRMREDWPTLLRNKFMGNAGSWFLGQRGNFMRALSGQIKSSLTSSLRNLVGSAQMGLAMADTGAAMPGMEDMDGMAPGRAAMAGGMIGGGVTQGLASALGKRIGRRLTGTRVGEFLERHGRTAGYLGESIPQHLTEFAHSDRLDDAPVVGSAVRWLKSQIIQAGAVQTGVQVDTLRNLQEPAPFTNLARKSITEIIPGFLARIYRELQILRTGDTKVELTSFDWTTSRFRDRSQTFKRAFEAVVKPSERQYVRQHAGSLIDELEKNSGVKLDDEQRQVLIRRLVRDNFANRSGSLKRYADVWTYAGEEAKHAGTFAKLFQQYGAQDRETRQREFHARFANLGGAIADPREMIQNLINAGMLEFAEEAGIVKNGVIDPQRLIDYYLSKEYTPGVEHAVGGLRGVGPGGEPGAVPGGARGPGRGPVSGVSSMAARRRAPRAIRTFARVPPRARPRRARPAQPLTGVTGLGQAAPPPATTVAGVAQQQTQQQAPTGEGEESEHPVHHGSAARDVDRFLQQKWGRSLQPAAMPAMSASPATPAFGTAHPFTHADALSGTTTGSVIEAIREHSSRPLVAKLYESVLAIQKKVEEGLLVMPGVPGISGLGTRLKGAARRAAAGTAQRLDEMKERFRDSIWHKGLADWTVGDLAGAGIGAMSAVGRAGRTWFGKAERLGAHALRSGFGIAKAGAGRGLEFIASLKDVYLPESSEPVLLAWKMRLGHYRDRATGTVIRSYRDIKGDVIDVTDGNNVVLQEKDIKRAYAKGRLKEKLISALGAGGKLIGGAAALLTGNVFPMAQRVLRTGMGLAKRGLALLDEPVDIYVKGESEPRLLAIMMRSGAYRSQLHEEKVILRPGMIDGPVLDVSERGNPKVVLRKEDLAKGLVDAQGRPIRTPLMKLAALVMAPVKGLFRSVKKGVGLIRDLALSPFRGLGEWFNKLVGPEGIVFAGSRTITQRLTEIRDLLTERLPKPRKRLVGDEEGTGLITNSWEDLQRRKALAEKGQAGEAAGEGGASRGLLAGLGGLLGKLRGRGKGKDEGEGDEEDGGGGLTGAAENWVEKKLGARLGKFGGGKLIRGAKWAGRGLKAIGGKGISRLLGRAALTEGAQALAGGEAVAAGATGAEALAATGEVIGAGVAAVGGFLSLPVLLGAAAVAGLGYLAYRGIKKLLEKKPGPLTRVRIAQYGFMPDDMDSVKVVLTLEATLMKGVWYREGKGGTQADISGKSINFREVVAPFDIDPANKSEVANFAMWYLRRFKPVFCTHLSALRSMGPVLHQAVNLTEVDEKLRSKADRQQYLKLVAWPGGPYNEMRSPFHGSILTLHRSLTLDSGPKTVSTYVAAAQAQIDKMPAEEAADAKAGAKKTGAVAAAAATQAKKKEDAKQDAARRQAASTPAKDQGKGWTDLLTDKVEAGVGDASGLIASMWGGVKGVAGKVASGVSTVAKDVVAGVAGAATRAGAAVAGAAGRVVSGVKETVAGVAGGLGAAGSAIRTGLQALGGRIGQLPLPTGRGWSALKDLIGKAASMVGVDPILLAAIGAIESAFNPAAKAPTSSASGLFQFINSTWQTMLRKYGAKYDIPAGTPQTDPRASALMGAEFIKENVAALKGVKSDITPTDVYLAHFLGPGGARQLLKADPGTDAVALMPGPAAANRSIFFNRDGSHRTVREVYAEIGRRVQFGLKQTGVSGGAVDVASAPVRTGDGKTAGKTTVATANPAGPAAPGTSGVNATNAPPPGAPARPASPASAASTGAVNTTANTAAGTAIGAAATSATTGVTGVRGTRGAGSTAAGPAAGMTAAASSAAAPVARPVATIPVVNPSKGALVPVAPRLAAPGAATGSVSGLINTALSKTGLVPQPGMNVMSGSALARLPAVGGFAGALAGASPFGFGPASAKPVGEGPKSIMAVQQAQHDQHMDALGGVGDTLASSLKVHEQALDVLKAMYALIQQAVSARQGTAANSGAGSPGAPATGLPTPTGGVSRPMPTPPVSMVRMA
ncbi:transglycosylase SLT domain-containing protein [Paraburkholderia adhaesiva]|uniref:transglycosylase SLT domain-containing protein n=1 Tax=Paraburkholderia adhaesiva TaxID=2883244 RepID=UPI001F1B070C|nr:transglycosylase SLT domain-containing protein [Paraburkholderia adhaesiva]